MARVGVSRLRIPRGASDPKIKIAYLNKGWFMPAPILVGSADVTNQARVLELVTPLHSIKSMPMFHTMRSQSQRFASNTDFQ